MVGHNVYFVEKSIPLLTRVLGYVGKDDDVMDPDIKMYVPEKFILGPFKERITGLVLQVERMIYDASAGILNKYQEAIKKGDLIIIKSGSMPESELELFANQAREHIKIKKAYYKSKDDMVRSMGVMMGYLEL